MRAAFGFVRRCYWREEINRLCYIHATEYTDYAQRTTQAITVEQATWLELS